MLRYMSSLVGLSVCVCVWGGGNPKVCATRTYAGLHNIVCVCVWVLDVPLDIVQRCRCTMLGILSLCHIHTHTHTPHTHTHTRTHTSCVKPSPDTKSPTT